MLEKNNKNFALDIEDIVWDLDVNYLEALQIYCEKHNIEIESVAPLVISDKVLYGKVKSNAEGLKYLRPEGAKLKL